MEQENWEMIFFYYRLEFLQILKIMRIRIISGCYYVICGNHFTFYLHSKVSYDMQVPQETEDLLYITICLTLSFLILFLLWKSIKRSHYS